jgi:hypothetical protein
MKLTLSRTAPGSMPNLSAMVTIRSGRLQVGIVKKETNQNWIGTLMIYLVILLFENKLNMPITQSDVKRKEQTKGYKVPSVSM